MKKMTSTVTNWPGSQRDSQQTWDMSPDAWTLSVRPSYTQRVHMNTHGSSVPVRVHMGVSVQSTCNADEGPQTKAPSLIPLSTVDLPITWDTQTTLPELGFSKL